jgi:adenosine deaminase
VFGYTLDDVLQWQLNAAEAAFLPSEEREYLAGYLTTEFGN